MLFAFKYEFISTESASNWRHFESSTKLVVSMSWGWKTDEKQHRGQSQIWRNYLDKKLVATFASLFSKLCFFYLFKRLMAVMMLRQFLEHTIRQLGSTPNKKTWNLTINPNSIQNECKYLFFCISFYLLIYCCCYFFCTQFFCYLSQRKI